MPLSSVEGLLVSLLFVVPGGLGLRVRRHLYSQPAASPFWEALSALGASLIALLTLEVAAGVIGATTRVHAEVGDSLVEPLLFDLAEDTLPWTAYFLYFGLAIILPTLGGWVVRTQWFGWLRAPSAHGLDYLVEDVRPKEERAIGPWVTVTTISNERFLGWLMWRSTPPDPLELVLGDVTDLNDPDDTTDPTWALWLPDRSISAAWVNVGRAADAVDAPEAENE